MDSLRKQKYTDMEDDEIAQAIYENVVLSRMNYPSSQEFLGTFSDVIRKRVLNKMLDAWSGKEDEDDVEMFRRILRKSGWDS